jgi:hypothetical protein
MADPTVWESFSRDQDVNTCQIVQRFVKTSYKAMSSYSKVIGDSSDYGSIAGVQSIDDIHNWNTNNALKQIYKDLNYTAWNGIYARSTGAGVAAKTRGLNSAITTIGKKVLNRIENSTENDYYIRRPLFISDLCQFTYDIIQNINNYNGIYHFYNLNNIATKYQIANIIANYLNKDMTNIYKAPKLEIKNILTDRPYDVNLIDDQYDITKYSLTPLSKGLEKCFHKLYHPKIFNTLNRLNIFLLFDLDDTLINSDKLHISCYNKAFETMNINLKILEEYLEHNSINHFLLLNAILISS